MMNSIRKSSQLVMLAFIMLLLASGCKSKKKAMEAAAAEKARMEQEASRKQQEEEMKRKEAEEKARRDAEAKELESKASTPKAKLTQYFDAVSRASNSTSANNSINEALGMFASPDTPVLIVISESGGQKDYDRPTTIRNYLNYLKDQKTNVNKISNLQFDASGKITEVELKKE
jgi:hypothetical protein